MAPTGEMPFLDHLEELRYRLLWSLGALVFCVAISFFLLTYTRLDVIGFLAAPIEPYLVGGKLVYTHPADAFSIVMKVAFVMGLLAAAPVIAYHIWRFLAPALHPHERRLVIPVVLGATGLFAAGVTLAVKFVFPVTLGFLTTFQSQSLTQMITATEYFSFAITMCLAFGGAFELPILILALTALGLVTPKTLAEYRRHAAVGCTIAAAIITPGDFLLSTLMLLVPLYGLYELSIILSWIVFRKKSRGEDASPSIGPVP